MSYHPNAGGESSPVTAQDNQRMFQPEPHVLQQVASLLRIGFNPTPENQQHVQRELDQYSQSPLFQLYLGFFLCHHDQAVQILQQQQQQQQTALTQQNAQALGQMAGLLLKTVVERFAVSTPRETLDQVKEFIIRTLDTATSTANRRSAGIVAATIARKTTLREWRQLLEKIYQALKGIQEGTGNIDVAKGYLFVFEKLCEDVQEQLIDTTEELGRPLNMLLPILLQILHSINEEEMQRMSLNCIMQFVEAMPPALSSHLYTYFQTLFRYTNSPNDSIRKAVYDSLVLLTYSSQSDVVVAHFDSVAERMLEAMHDSEPTVAMSATEFWSIFAQYRNDADGGSDIEKLDPFLERVVTILLQNMRYSDEELADAAIDNTHDWNVPDKIQDVKPWVRKDKKKKTEDAEEEEDSGGVKSYTLRRVSAHTLDTLAVCCGNAVAKPLLRLLPSFLEAQGESQEQWMRRDIGVLALGAVSDGCYDDLEEHLPKLIPYLVKLTGDNIPAVRAVSAWCLSRFAEFVCAFDDEPYGLRTVLPVVLNCAVDGVKHVQWYSLSAVVELVKSMGEKVELFSEEITNCFMKAGQIYQMKSRMLLYDAIAELAESYPALLLHHKFRANVLQPLIQRFLDLPLDQDVELLPLMEVVGSIAMNTKEKFIDFAKPVFDKAKYILETGVTQIAARKEDNDDLELDLLNTSIDLIAGIAEGIESSFEALLNESGGSSLLQLLLYCCSEGPDTRQSVYALFGDFAQYAFSFINTETTLQVIIEKLLQHLDSDDFYEINNAVWATGEIISRSDPSFAHKYGPTVIERLLHWFQDLRTANPLLLENLGMIIGRIALVAPEVVGHFLPSIVVPWCQTLSLITDEQEKYASFQGLVKLMEKYPQPFLQHVHAVLFTIACWYSTTYGSGAHSGLHSSFQTLINQFRSQCGNQWSQIASQLQPEVKEVLSAAFPGAFSPSS